VTIPTQLRARLRTDGRGFRALAPNRRPVAIQLWSVRRVAVTSTLLSAGAAGILLIYAYARLAGLL